MTEGIGVSLFLVLPTVLIVCFLAAMAVCAYIVHKTDKTEGLVHLAEVIRAFLRSRK
jgi:hypothetical protein